MKIIGGEKITEQESMQTHAWEDHPLQQNYRRVGV